MPDELKTITWLQFPRTRSQEGGGGKPERGGKQKGSSLLEEGPEESRGCPKERGREGTKKKGHSKVGPITRKK